MRTAAILFTALLLALPAHARQDTREEMDAARWSHARALSVESRRLLSEAIDRSPYIRSQLDALEKTDVVIYLTHSMPRHTTCLHGHLQFVSGAGRYRFLGVWIDTLAAPAERLELLGHELQHALEVAAEPSVRSESALASLYRRIGHKAGDCYETRAAVLAAMRVRDDLTASSTTLMAERVTGSPRLQDPLR